MSSRAMAIVMAFAVAGCATAQAPAARDPACDMAAGEELVNVRKLDPTIRVDVRYATPNNFTGRTLPGYDAPIVLLRPAAASALVRVQQRLAQQGLGLKIFDGYRPIRATQGMVGWAERSGNRWVLEQGYVARQSGHNRGATVDLTIVRLRDGRELPMGTLYDTFSEAAHTANATGQVRENRMTLVSAMQAEGFRNYEKEWWHFSLPGTYTAVDLPLSCFN